MTLTSGPPSPPSSSALSTVMRTAWLLRVVAFVGVTAIILAGRRDHFAEAVAALVVVGVTLAGWAAIDRAARHGRQMPGLVLTVILAAMGLAAGLVTALPVSDSIVAFALVAAIGAGSDLDIGPACAVAATTILAIEVSSLAFGFSAGGVGWPLAVVAAVLVGRNRRDARVQSAQAAALIAQGEQTRVQEQRAATLDERARIAREIHDLLAHSLGALGIQIGAALALLTDARDIDRAVPLLDQARRAAASGLEETRRAIEALRIDTPPLPLSLTAMAEAHIDEHCSPVDLTITGAPRALNPDANLALIRIAHEALANAAKHAPAAPIAIALDYGPDRTTVTVTNTPDPAHQAPAAASTTVAGASGGYGLAGMRERLALIGGTLTAGPAGAGWAVRAQIPL